MSRGTSGAVAQDFSDSMEETTVHSVMTSSALDVAHRSTTADARSSPHPSALFRPCLRLSGRVPVRSVPLKPISIAAGGGFDGTGRAGTRSDGRNSADGCGDDRA